MKTGDKDTIDSLLNPLGLNVEWNKIINGWAIASWKTVCKCYSRKRDGRFIGWVDLKCLENDLLTNIEAFVLWSSWNPYNGSRIKNPYLGCANLEEALIRRDLISSSIQVLDE